MTDLEVCGPVQQVEVSVPLPVVKVNITKVRNGFLVEPKDKHWNGEESVYLDLDSTIEAVRTSLT